MVLVYAGNPKGVRPDWPAASFNHAIVGLPADTETPVGWPSVEVGGVGRLVLFDPTDAYTPLGVLSPSLRGGYGLAASTQAEGLIALPSGGVTHDRYESRVEATLEADGVLSAHIAEIALGAPGVQCRASREQLRNERFGRSLEARLQETMASVRDVKWSDSWDPVTAQWTLTFDFKAERYARRTASSLMLVSPQVTFTKTRLAPWKTTQDGVVWFGSASLRKDVRLTLPAEATIEELPADWSRELEGVSCHLRYRREARVVVCEASFTHESRFLDRSSYEALRNLVQKMQEAERRPVVIRLDRATTPGATERPAVAPAPGAAK